MASLLRILLVFAALLSGGVLQVASAMGDDDACCAGETNDEGAPCTNCPPGLACACCPLRGAVENAPVVTPPESSGVAVTATCVEPVVGPPVTDIFHPPRA